MDNNSSSEGKKTISLYMIFILNDHFQNPIRKTIIRASARTLNSAQLCVDSASTMKSMKCRLIHFRLFAEYLTGIFFVASGIVVLSAYFRTEAEDDIFKQERTVLLVVGIIHLTIFVQCLLSCAYTKKLLR